MQGTKDHDPYRVLLVDDDSALLASSLAVLAEHFEVSGCSSAQHALRLLERECFHVVCTDWQMPGMDGLEFFREVARRALPLPPSFLLITGHVDDLLAEVPYDDRRMLGMLRKPVNPAQLIDSLRQLGAIARLKQACVELNAMVAGEPR